MTSGDTASCSRSSRGATWLSATNRQLSAVAWAFLRPFLTMVVFTVIFGKLAKLPSDGTAPYPLMVFAGMLPWQFFATALSEASNSLIFNANLIGKVYFPRLIVPTATVVVALVDFLISFVILVGMMIWYRFVPEWQIVPVTNLCRESRFLRVSGRAFGLPP